MKLYVLKQKRPIGYLEEKVFGKISFTYFKDIVPEAYLPGLQKKENFSEDGLFAVFNNFLPENNQIELLRQKHKIRNNIGVLLHLDNIHGSYEFISEEDYVENVIESPTIIVYELVKQNILYNNYTYPNILNGYTIDVQDNIMFPDGIENSNIIGLSGFQYKFSIDVNHNSKTLSKGENSEYFIKPYSKHYSTFAPKEKNRLYIPYLLINEHIFMSMAKDLSFDVPYNAIIKQGHDYHYIIKRFDRHQGLAFDHVEFATLLGLKSDKKYLPTLKQIFDTANDYLDISELHELMRFFIFSIIISHGDLHSKNISLINKSNSLSEINKSISPYYDISTTKIYKEINQKDIGMKLDNKTSNIKRIDILNFSKLLGFDVQEINNMISTLCHYFIDNFKTKYIAHLPPEIRVLPFYTRTYGKPDSFESILNKYYENRCKYIETCLEIKIEESFF